MLHEANQLVYKCWCYHFLINLAMQTDWCLEISLYILDKIPWIFPPLASFSYYIANF
jgi:hypothetical protein